MKSECDRTSLRLIMLNVKYDFMKINSTLAKIREEKIEGGNRAMILLVKAL